MQACSRLLVVAVVLVAGCAGAGSSTGASVPRTTSPDALEGEVTVFAAASLTDVFAEIGKAFTTEHPGVRVVFNFAGSQQLATQIVEGAPADVFASADAARMDVVREAGLAGVPRVFAGNALSIAVEAGNPRGVTGPADLARDELRVVLAAEEVPAGRYARQALDRARVVVEPVSLETDVRAVLGKIRLGEADAGIVYSSDVTAAGDAVGQVPIPAGHNVEAAYPVATIPGGPNAAAGEAFAAFLQREPARQILARHGFVAP